jgi:hypothetical protein
MNFLDYLVNAMTGGQPTEQELMARQMAQQGLLNQQTELMPRIPPVMTPEMLRNMTPPIAPPTSNQGPMSPYMQNLINPGKTMQQNYIDPRLMEQMYYKGLLSR